MVPKLHLCLLGWLAASSVLLRINRRGFAAAATAAEAHDATADLQVVGHTMRKMQALQFGGILGRSVDNSVPKSTRATQGGALLPAAGVLGGPSGGSLPDWDKNFPWLTKRRPGGPDLDLPEGSDQPFGSGQAPNATAVKQPAGRASARAAPLAAGASARAATPQQMPTFGKWLNAIKQERLAKLKDWVRTDTFPVKLSAGRTGLGLPIRLYTVPMKDAFGYGACRRCHKECTIARAFLDTAWCEGLLKDDAAFARVSDKDPQGLVLVPTCDCVSFKGYRKSAAGAATEVQVITPRDLGIVGA